MKNSYINLPLFKVLRTQIVNEPEARFMFAIIEQAINDVTAEAPPKPIDESKLNGWVARANNIKYQKQSALHFLSGSHCRNICLLIGLDFEWFHDMLKRAKVI